MTETEKPNKVEDEAISFAQFLESTPPNQRRTITDIATASNIMRANVVSGYTLRLTKPEIQIHCSNAECNGPRFFRTTDRSVSPLQPDQQNIGDIYLNYECSNCRKSTKTLSLRFLHSGGREEKGSAIKFGEYPAFGPPTPQRLLKLLEDQRETFLRGRRCENQGLGIGAFAYYRRVVDHQRGRIMDEIIKAAEKQATPTETINLLREAKAEDQFSRSVEMIKDAIPQSLLIQGHHNPLTLLYSALSKGLHAETDEVCLELAQSIRIVLGELAERLAAALKNDAELNAAVSRLLKS